MELKFNFQLKDLSESGTFTGYASVFNNVDLGDDIVSPGAFTKTMKENATVPILWGHDQSNVIGVNQKWEEDKRGLLVTGALALNVQKGREAYELAKMGAVKGLSIGYSPITLDHSRAKDGVRIIKEAKVFEYSLTPFPMNQRALITSVKSAADAKCELARLKKFIRTTTLSQSEKVSVTSDLADILALLATSESKMEEAGEVAAAQESVAPEDFHAALEDFRADLKKKLQFNGE